MTFMYLGKLKEELKLIQKSINRYNTYPIQNNDIWGSYRIALKNGTLIYINMETRFFPRFNFNDILLIIKKNLSYCEEDGDHFFDSETGDYIAEKMNFYEIDIKSKLYTFDED